MSGVRVRVTAPVTDAGPPGARVRLDLAELLAAARLAGDVPLPVTPLGARPADHRLAERLGAAADHRPRRVVAAAVGRADDPGPSGAPAGLADRGLVTDGALHPGLAAGLRVLAGGPASMVLDLVVATGGRSRRLRGWFAAGAGLAARLATVDGLRYDLAWFDPARWAGEVVRAVTVEPTPGPPPAGGGLPERVVLPSELFVGALRAHREHRTDLLPPMVTSHPGTRFGDGRGLRAAPPAEVLALLRRLGDTCPGRLRLRAGLRDRDDATAHVSAWLRLGAGWHELRPGPHATTVLQRGDPAVLGPATARLARAAQEVA